MKQVAIFGASGFGREVMPIARQVWGVTGSPYEIVFVDDFSPVSVCNRHDVLTYAEWLDRPASSRHVSIAISDSVVRKRLAERCLADKIEFFEVCAENVQKFDEVRIGEGAILAPFVTLTSNIQIGAHFQANLYSYVAHDCLIGDYVTFAPGVKCNGNVVVEDHAYIGTGAVIKQGRPQEPLVIGKGAVVGMGAVVTKSVPAGTTVTGIPAKPVVR